MVQGIATRLSITAFAWNGWGNSHVYELDPPYKEGKSEYKWVLISKVTSFTAGETLMFPCAKNGALTGWGQLSPSRFGKYSHEEILEIAGYRVSNGVRRAIRAIKKGK